MYVWFPLSFRNAEDLLYELGFDVRHKAVQYWWRRSGRDFVLEVWKRRIDLRAQEDDGVKSGSPSVPFEPVGIQFLGDTRLKTMAYEVEDVRRQTHHQLIEARAGEAVDHEP